MAFLNFAGAATAAAPSGLWTWLILDVFGGFIANYGWAVVLFTFLLKIVLSPLDIYQRVAMKKNQRITERIQPELEKLKKQYANNPQALQKKQREINKREGYSLMAGCLPMLVTLVISIWLLTELSGISQYKNMTNYIDLYKDFTSAELTSYSKVLTEDDVPGGAGQNVYLVTIDEATGEPVSASFNYAVFGLPEEGLPTDDTTWTDEQRAAVELLNRYEAIAKPQAKQAGEKAVAEKYESRREGFLWVQNIWIADVPWQSAVMKKADFQKAVAKYATDPYKFYGVKKGTEISPEQRAEWSNMLARYDEVTGVLQNDSVKNRANGYLVLPILSIAVMLTSQFLTRKMQSKSGLAGQNPLGSGSTGKMMVFIMPLMFGIFSLFYTTAFSLYMIVNSSTMIMVSLTAGLVLRLTDKREHKKEVATDEGIIRIGRPDPNAPPPAKSQNPHGNAGKRKKK